MKDTRSQTKRTENNSIQLFEENPVKMYILDEEGEHRHL